MKILMLVPYLPTITMSGGQTRWYNIIKYLTKKHDITLFSLIKDDSEKRFIPELEKYFSRPAVQSEAGPLPFTNLFVLCESDDETSFEEVLGSEKLRELTGSLYHPEIYGAISINETHAARLLRMARAVRIWRFRRPRDSAEFSYSTDKLVEFLDGLR